jgi:hypothetical protein
MGEEPDKKMNLGEALIEHKTMKSELVRLMNLRERTFNYEDKPDEDFAEVTKKIEAHAEKLRKLKIRIENANHSTYIDTPSGKMTIAEAIHLIGDMRSELSKLEKLTEMYEEDRYGLREAQKKKKHQLSQKELNELIGALEKKKAKFDKFLSAWNWKVELKG